MINVSWVSRCFLVEIFVAVQIAFKKKKKKKKEQKAAEA